MEYSKTLVSLYENNNSLPQLFLEINKKSNEYFVCLHSNKKVCGILIFYSNNNFVWGEIDGSKNELIFKCEDINENQFIVCFYENKMFLGKIGDLNITKKIMFEFDKIYEKCLIERKIKNENKYDTDKIIEDISLKLFQTCNLDFFESTRNKLETVFKIGKKEKTLETQIDSSRFVSVLQGGKKMYYGIVFKNEQPLSIAVGYCDQQKKENVSSEGRKFYIIEENLNGNINEKLISLCFRNARDGDIVNKI